MDEKKRKANSHMFLEYLMVFILYGSKIFSTVREVTNSSTRPKRKTDAGARSMDVLGPKMWNNLSLDITKSASLQSFRCKLKHLLRY